MKSYLTFILSLLSITIYAQKFTPNYDESKIPNYQLPEVLVSHNGVKISSKEQWQKVRREEILSDFETHMYGNIPDGDVQVSIEKIGEKSALGGKAIMREVRMSFTKNDKNLSMEILMYLPKTKDKVPMFVGLNFKGNHTVNDDPEISLTESWIGNDDKFYITNNKVSEASRGMRQNRWAVEKIIDRGYGLATIYYGDIDPDKDDFTDGIHSLYYSKGQLRPTRDEWGSVAAWAWGLSRAMDYFEKDSNIDAAKVALMGHSRLGKASLWAGAADERFAIVISNDSGCGGAALSRRRIGETVWRINNSFPHWFNDHFNDYSNNEDDLPFDQHMLIALIAPRPVYVASAVEDNWADPKGELLSAYYAGEVYSLFGLEGLPSDELPAVDQPVHKTIGYHIRSGGHDVKDFDWEAWMDFADIHFSN